MRSGTVDVHENEDFLDEDTAPGDDTPMPAGRNGKDEPRHELMWVEDPGMGMVLRVVPVGGVRSTRDE